MSEIEEEFKEYGKGIARKLDELMFNEAMKQLDAKKPEYRYTITYYKKIWFIVIKRKIKTGVMLNGLVDFIKEHNIKTFDEYIEKAKKYIKDKRDE